MNLPLIGKNLAKKNTLLPADAGLNNIPRDPW
jgi:hypothetical protein